MCLSKTHYSTVTLCISIKYLMPLQTVPVEIKEYRSILIVGGANYELPTDEGD